MQAHTCNDLTWRSIQVMIGSTLQWFSLWNENIDVEVGVITFIRKEVNLSIILKIHSIKLQVGTEVRCRTRLSGRFTNVTSIIKTGRVLTPCIDVDCNCGVHMKTVMISKVGIF